MSRVSVTDRHHRPSLRPFTSRDDGDGYGSWRDMEREERHRLVIIPDTAKVTTAALTYAQS